MSVQNSEIKKVVGYLKHLGLTTEQASIYLQLLSGGPQTVLQISRALQTGRTKLYPLLETLADKQLITIHERHYGTSYETTGLDSLDFLVAEHERKAENLRSSLPSVRQLIETIALASPASTRVVEYRGIDGLKQMNYNLATKNTGAYRVLELARLDVHLGKPFASKMRQIDADRGTITYDLTNDPERAQKPGIETKNNLTAYIDPSIFTIEFETYTYANVTSFLGYDQDDIFGIEVHSPKLARQQVQLFDLLWAQAKKL